MSDQGPMTLHDVLLAYSELIRFHQSILRGHESPLPFKVQAAHDLRSDLDAVLRCLNVTQVQAEVEQTQRIVAEWRGGLPGALEGDEDR